MEAKIDVTGMLIIEAETELEAYAISKWSEENMGQGKEPLMQLSWGLAEIYKTKKE